ncbi:MAG: hypothetical protein ABEJ30_07485 [Halorientalis sp.]
MSDGGEERPSDTMRERVPENSLKFWFMLAADRWVVTGIFLAVVFLGLVALGFFHPTPTRTLLLRGDPLETLFGAIVGATVTGVTVVLTLSQLVLSQEQGPVGDQRERMDGAMTFRRDVESLLEEPVSPAQPSAFLRSLVDLTRRRAETVQSAVEDIDSDRLDQQVERFVDNLEDNAEAVAANLEGAQFGEFDVVFSALNYNYSLKLYAARRIRAENDAVLTDEARAAFDDLVDALELFGPAREHFKTLYFQWELTNLSRTILFTAIPALVVSAGSLLFFDARDVTTATLGISDALLVVALAVTVSLAPFAILLAYVLRIVTVTKRTLSVGPFILRETDRSHALEGDDAAGGTDE